MARWSRSLALLLALLVGVAPAEEEDVAALSMIARLQLQLQRDQRRAFPLVDVATDWRRSGVDWASFDKIIVVGPQRSGTTFFAQALAAHLGHVFLDEGDETTLFTDATTGERFTSGLPQWFRFLHAAEGVVAQRPQLTFTIEQYNFTRMAPRARVLVAFVARDCVDVLRSQNRIQPVPGVARSWTCTFGEMEQQAYAAKAHLTPHFDPNDPVCLVKQDVWAGYQLPLMRARGDNVATVAFDSFSSLPRFAEASRRNASALAFKQTIFGEAEEDSALEVPVYADSGASLPNSTSAVEPPVSLAALEQLLAAHSRWNPLWDAPSWREVDWRAFTHIVVVGPLGSGLSQLAALVGGTTGYEVLDSKTPMPAGATPAQSADQDTAFFGSMSAYGGIVAVRPRLTAHVHKLRLAAGSHLVGRTLVVFLARNCLDVARVQHSVLPVTSPHGSWPCVMDPGLLRPYRQQPELKAHFDGADPSCKVQQDVWRHYQRTRLEADPLLPAAATVSFASVAIDAGRLLPQAPDAAPAGTVGLGAFPEARM